jgi:alcohol dehydrogenase
VRGNKGKKMTKTIFITGIGSGIGRALAEKHIERGNRVYAIGRHEDKSIMSHPHFHFFHLDFHEPELIRDDLRTFVHKIHFDRVILNAGMCSEVRDMLEIPLEEMRDVMNVNLWSHKQVIDALMIHANVDQVVAIGASPSVFEHRGCGAFALSKAALQALIQLYAEEFPNTHFGVLLPDLIQTPMLSKILQDTDPMRYPIVKQIQESRVMPLDQAIPKLMDAFVKIKQLKNGTTMEMRKLKI